MLNVADWLSLSRIALLPILIWAVLASRYWLAAVLFTLAIASDLLDGAIARSRNMASARGALLDHGSDAVFVVVTLGLWASEGLVPAVLPALVALAFTQYALDSRGALPARLRPSRLGRFNGIAYFVLSGLALAVAAMPALVALRPLSLVLGWVLVATTVQSIALRALWSLRR